ncbi:MAG TPA: TIGR02996 domain-containing protein [Gemmata sp.]
MLSDRDALLAAIRTDPDEDTPRLALADWLSENGEEARAEFIRAQCELAAARHEYGGSHAMYEFLRDRYHHGLLTTDWTRIDAGVHRLVALERRATELLKGHRADWEPKLPKKLKAWWPDGITDEAQLGGFERGFPHRLVLGAPADLRPLADRLRTVPPVTLVAHTFTPDLVARLAEAGLVGWGAGLDLRGDCAAGLRAFGHLPEAATVRAIKLRYADMDVNAPALADAPHWTGLHALDLTETAMHVDAFAALVAAKRLSGLRRLHIRGSNDWHADHVRALLADGFPNLVSLRLTNCGLDDEAAAVLAGSPALAGVRDLDLAHNRIGGHGLTELLCSPHLTRLAYLGLDFNPLHGTDADRLAAQPGAELRLLNCHGGRLRAADIRALTRSPRLRTLWYLDFDDNGVGVQGVRELVRGCGTWCPPILWLIRNRIDDRAAGVLANWKGATGLTALHVKYNSQLTDVGLRTLLASPHFVNLGALGASPGDAAMEAALRARFKHEDGY